MKFNDQYVKKFIECVYDKFEKKIADSDRLIREKKCLGNDMLGWKEFDTNLNLKVIKNISNEIMSSSDCVLVIGIGGSYLGSKMAIDFLRPKYRDNIFFIGQNLDSEYIIDILNRCENKSVHVLIVSKSGNTIEIKSTLNIVLNFMQKKYGNDLSKRFTAVTGKTGYLRSLASEKKWAILDIPENVGGRFSVLTHAGLLVISLSGANLDNIIEGAISIKNCVKNSQSDCHKYAITRSILYNLGFKIELFVSFSNRIISAIEWLKQLFGESEGKNGGGLFPASAFFSTDLHSLGQFIQEGSKILFESVIFCQNLSKNLFIGTDCDDNYLRGKNFNEINIKILNSSVKAHFGGGVPCNLIYLDDFSEKELGKFIYFFEYACSLSAVTLGVNPFNQPGVEVYKKGIYL